MGIGRAIGYGLLALVDAVVPTVVAMFVVAFTLVGHDVGGYGGGTVALAAGGVTFLGTLGASAVSHARGGTPFAFTRLAKVAWHFFWYWPPWALNRRRKNR
jgi:hypothetical protein